MPWTEPKTGEAKSRVPTMTDVRCAMQATAGMRNGCWST